MKIKKKNFGGWGGVGGVRGGVRVDVNEELKFLWKFKKKIWGGVGGGGGFGGQWERSGWAGGSGWM